MKKFLSLVLLSLMVIMPLNVANAATRKISIGDKVTNTDGSYTYTLYYTTETTDPISTVTVTLTEQGGADITSIVSASGSDFAVNSYSETSTGVWTVEVQSIEEVAGDQALFTFTYTPSGETDCKILVSIDDVTFTVEETTDTTTDNVQTGSTLPYIALGAIVVVAGVAYVATRNKSKMYKI